MTVNDFIRELQSLQPKLREKEIVIMMPNGILVEPKAKMVLADPMNIFGGIDNVKQMIITCNDF